MTRGVRGVRGLPAAVSTVVWGAVLPSLGSGQRSRTALSAGVGIGAVIAARASGPDREALGLAPARVGAGLRWGSGAATLVAAAYGCALAVPALRERFVDPGKASRDDFHEWVGVHIPFGTVLPEELLFRSVLGAVASPTVQAVAFGLWHVRPAILAGDDVLGTVAVTGLSGWVFDRLRRRSGSVLAPMLAHLAINAGGALTVRAATALAGPGRPQRAQ